MYFIIKWRLSVCTNASQTCKTTFEGPYQPRAPCYQIPWLFQHMAQWLGHCIVTAPATILTLLLLLSRQSCFCPGSAITVPCFPASPNGFPVTHEESLCCFCDCWDFTPSSPTDTLFFLLLEAPSSYLLSSPTSKLFSWFVPKLILNHFSSVTFFSKLPNLILPQFSIT